MAKAKKLNVSKVEEELRLLACGADGGEFEPDDEYTRNLFGMDLGNLERFACAIVSKWFGSDDSDELLFMRVNYCDCWETYATLAAAIVKERARLDAVKAREAGNATD